jgi:hypothetical protein
MDISLRLEPVPSAWTFDGSGGGGVGLGFFAASRGTLQLKDPHGKSHQFGYGGVGAGISTPGVKLPKIGQLDIGKLDVSSAVGPAPFTSVGRVFKMKSIATGSDLTVNDFKGYCVLLDVGAGVVAGGGATAMLFGIPLYAGGLIAVPKIGVQLFLKTARGLVLMAGYNVGIQLGAGVSSQIGIMR